ncbi:MAG: GNAT family N-acetyltransferase [Pseudoflavonifractor sp.]|nr:GNAT family N-acetyltransferase [Alloprevotella sp.]MCM1116752.1 GNAT family N-acetyltransferase [Pseudoflavonifractor sp.]
MTPQTIISPVDPDLIERELTPDRLLRHTNKAHNLIYVIDGRECPDTMREIGRLREIAFRAAGGGTGKETDIDEYDLMDPPCRQLIVWDPATREILGGYRFIIGEDIRLHPDGSPRIAMAHMFRFSERFIKECLPFTIELGRSFVRTEYQSTRAGVKALFVLDNLWDGLGALTVVYPSVKYLLGKVTMYPDYSRECRDMLLFFLNKHFPDPDHLVWPMSPLEITTPREHLEALFTGSSFKEDYHILHHSIREHGLAIPPLVNAYMSLSPTMKMFGTAINDEFGDVEESGIFFAISDITEEKKGRHILTFNE